MPARGRGLFAQLAGLTPDQRRAFAEGLDKRQLQALLADSDDFERYWARPAQRWPAGDWLVWLIEAGRGFGKTKTGAEYMHRVAKQSPRMHMALVARTDDDIRDTMIEGDSGLLRTGWRDFRPEYEPSKHRVTWPNGAWATCYSSVQPSKLRGPNICFAWCDELAAWRRARECWEQIEFTLRIGEHPRVIVTTTPKPIKFYRELRSWDGTVITRGSTFENAANLAPVFLANLRKKYEGTATGRQELNAEVLDEAEGALWKRAALERDRIRREDLPRLDRVVVALDPSATSKSTSAEAGIVAAGVRFNAAPLPDDFYVLADGSERLSPDAWGRRAIELYDAYQADRLVGEANHGGDMIETVLRTIRPNLSYRTVHASVGKRVRAEPVAALTEQQRLHLVGPLEQLEDQLCNWDPRASDESPDRLDAMVWAITELMDNRPEPTPDLGQVADFGQRVSPWDLDQAS